MNLNERIHRAKGHCIHQNTYIGHDLRATCSGGLKPCDHTVLICDECDSTSICWDSKTEKPQTVIGNPIPDYLNDAAETFNALEEAPIITLKKATTHDGWIAICTGINYGLHNLHEPGLTPKQAIWTAWCEWMESK